LKCLSEAKAHESIVNRSPWVIKAISWGNLEFFKIFFPFISFNNFKTYIFIPFYFSIFNSLQLFLANP